MIYSSAATAVHEFKRDYFNLILYFPRRPLCSLDFESEHRLIQLLGFAAFRKVACDRILWITTSLLSPKCNIKLQNIIDFSTMNFNYFGRHRRGKLTSSPVRVCLCCKVNHHFVAVCLSDGVFPPPKKIFRLPKFATIIIPVSMTLNTSVMRVVRTIHPRNKKFVTSGLERISHWFSFLNQWNIHLSRAQIARTKVSARKAVRLALKSLSYFHGARYNLQG